MDYRPYVSLDIETTGLDKANCDILEIGAVKDYGQNWYNMPLLAEDKLHLRIIPNKGRFNGAEPYALMLNQKLISYLAKGNSTGFVDEEGVEWVTKEEAAKRLQYFLKEAGEEAGIWDKDHGLPVRSNPKVEIAGKNAAVFDIPFIDNFFGFSFGEFTWLGMFNIVQRRVIDVGSIYYTDFGFLPSLDQINEKLGRKPVTHNAVDDALDVAIAIRKKYNNK